jgi:hypothetical protein
LQALLSVNVSMPQVPVMNFFEALNFNPNSSLSAQLDLNNGSNSQATVTLKVSSFYTYINSSYCTVDRLCGPVVRVPGYRSRGPGSIPGSTRFSEK